MKIAALTPPAPPDRPAQDIADLDIAGLIDRAQRGAFSY